MDNTIEKFDIVTSTFAKSITFQFKPENESPIPLISYDETNGYYINKASEKFFENIATGKLGIISVVGKSRTGKSYLLNRVLLNKTSGFQVGHSINPCTKGIWIWPSQIEIENKNNPEDKMKVIIMDTEGIGATDQDDNHDSKIFLLSLLLSSYFIHNSVGTIDEKAIQNLSLIVNLSKHLQQNNEKEFEDLLETFPSFLWVLRDFTLKLVDPNGNPLTAKEYLENSLKPQKGFSESIETKNRIRRVLAQFFKDRDCSMLVRPTENEKDIQNLNTIPFTSLRQEFNDQINILRRKIYSKIKPKIFKGEPINGKRFLILAQLLCNLINQGGVLAIDDSWNNVCRNECQKLVGEMIEKYETMFKNQMQDHVLDHQRMKTLHKKFKGDIMEEFKRRAMGEQSNKFEKELNTLLKGKYKYLVEENYMLLKDKLEEIIQSKVGDLKNDINRGIFQNFKEFLESFKLLQSKLYNTYQDTVQKGLISELLINSLNELTQVYIDKAFEKMEINENIHKEKMKGLQKDIQNLKSKHEQAINESLENLQKINIEKLKFGTKVTDLEEELKTSKEENNLLKLKLEDTIKSINIRNTEIEESYKCQISQLEDKITQYENTKKLHNEEQEKLLKTQTNEIESKQKELEIKQKEVEIKQKEIETKQKELENIEKKLGLLKKDLDDEKSKNNILTESISKLERELERTACTTQIIDKSTFAELNETSSPMSSSNNLNSIQKRLSIFDKNLSSVESSSLTERRFNIKDTTENNTLTADNKKLIEENKQLKTKISKLEDDIKKLNNEINCKKSNFDLDLKNMQKDFHDTTQNHQDLIFSLKKSIKTYQKTDMAIIEANRNLLMALEKAEKKCYLLEKKVDKFQECSTMIKNSSNIQCKICEEYYPSNLFSAHLTLCLDDTPNEKYLVVGDSIDPPTFAVTVQNNKQKTSQKENNCYKEFMIEVKFGNKNWKISKNSSSLESFFKDIKEQANDMNIMINLPPSLSKKPNQNSNLLNDHAFNHLNLEKDCKMIQDTLNNLAQIPNINEIPAFKSLIEFTNFNTIENFTQKLSEINNQRREPLTERLYE